ncbi:hypothetical protein GCM10010168_09170 [Actinoplanes ianthinogenes]|uniref:Uncharacterized protein n=1 Tax=Actinoplanes ianthinogenes TaxID=122358 RepID=A0ABM7LXP3_9ACTN|nr:hypothetical protein Aiant_47610 [Actinoplanes ianthinogenes]GGQ95827.1 hypothetical protein GCM10010168_09170 [Actinoplanes ianthinogenes]
MHRIPFVELSYITMIVADPRFKTVGRARTITAGMRNMPIKPNSSVRPIAASAVLTVRKHRIGGGQWVANVPGVASGGTGARMRQRIH